jgi:hypothetical protein
MFLFSPWGIFKNRHLSNATGRIRDESLMNLGGRGVYFSKQFYCKMPNDNTTTNELLEVTFKTQKKSYPRFVQYVCPRIGETTLVNDKKISIQIFIFFEGLALLG